MVEFYKVPTKESKALLSRKQSQVGEDFLQVLRSSPRGEMRDLREPKIYIPGEIEKARGKREESIPDFRPFLEIRTHKEPVFGETFPSQEICQEVSPVDGKRYLTGSKKVKVGIKDEKIR